MLLLPDSFWPECRCNGELAWGTKIRMRRAKGRGVWALYTVRPSGQMWAHVQNYVHVRNKLLSQSSIHCWVIITAAKPVFWWMRNGSELGQGSVRSVVLDYQCWSRLRDPMVSFQFLLYGYPMYSKMESVPKKLSCNSYIVSFFGTCLPPCATVDHFDLAPLDLL